MQKSLTKNSAGIYSEVPGIIAELYEVTADYVRKVVADKKRKKYNSKTADNIREAYKQYVAGKSNLIKAIEKSIAC